ncbi:MAG: cytochrome bc complex cytochrome b subunit [Myxococcales bacterium]|nr:cytochrome bc complex cytochrome b subunit [Myxococcales bacterium]
MATRAPTAQPRAPGASGSWLGDRTGWTVGAARLATHRIGPWEVERYAAVAAAVLMLLLVASGIALSMHYRPNATEARGSVVEIASAIPFGNLVRGVHQWASDLLVACMWALCLALCMRRLYRRPGELVWLAALLGLLLVTQIAFTGAVLPWTASARDQARMVGGMARSVPLVGEGLAHFVLGGPDVGAATLPRAYGFHIAVLPAIITLVAVAYWRLAARMSEGLAERRAVAGVVPARTIAVYPDFALRAVAVAVAVVLVVMSLATFVPRVPGMTGGEAETPPWYLAFFHQILRKSPPDLLGIPGPQFIGGVMTAILLVVAALPFIDPRGSKVTRWLALVGLAGIAALTVYGLQ